MRIVFDSTVGAGVFGGESIDRTAAYIGQELVDDFLVVGIHERAFGLPVNGVTGGFGLNRAAMEDEMELRKEIFAGIGRVSGEGVLVERAMVVNGPVMSHDILLGAGMRYGDAAENESGEQRERW